MSDSRFGDGRHIGALVPLFSIPSRQSWGIGEIPDLARFAVWLREAGLDYVMVLPVNEMGDGQNSPYSAMSAMAIDPLYIALAEVPEFTAAGGESALPSADRMTLDEARRAPRVAYRPIRDIKKRALRRAFSRFEEREWRTESARAATFREFIDRERWWLDDYALFRALHHAHEGRYWLEWDAGIRNRHPDALDEARQRFAQEIRYRAWLQWIADDQWQHARRECRSVAIFGDFPFIVSRDSADVWARQAEFRVDASVGTPPDAFSATGQDWGLPVYRWDVIAPEFEWLRQRARRSAELYDGFRVDHLVGFYRTYVRERAGTAAFVPADEASQIAQGERLLAIFGERGAQIVAEDLGSVPEFVRESMGRLGVPGYKVLRWERFWDEPGRPFRDPATYPAISLATSSTHDTETLAEWWDTAPAKERAAIAEIPSLRESGCDPTAEFSDSVRDALLRAICGSGSNLVLVPVQDIFGWRDRINTPAVVDDLNWTWRLPWPVDALAAQPIAQERAGFLRSTLEECGRARSIPHPSS
jgi:4-alpha-glucanotransferase